MLLGARVYLAHKDPIKSKNIKVHPFIANFRTKAGNRYRDRKYGLQQMANLSDAEFVKVFRLTRPAFAKLHKMLKPLLSVKMPFRGISSSGSTVPTVTKLAATLRWLAGGSFLDISLLFGLDFTNFFNKNYFLWQTIEAIDSVLELGFSLDPDYLKSTADGFAELSRGRMLDCVMAIDGWVCHTRRPTIKEVGKSVMNYRNRKACFGLVVMAGCDSKCRFTLISAKCSGGTHDHVAWEATSMKDICDNHLPDPFYFIGF